MRENYRIDDCFNLPDCMYFWRSKDLDIDVVKVSVFSEQKQPCEPACKSEA